MRFPVITILLVILFGSVAHAQIPPPPDASPSTPVDMVELPAFEPTREDAVLEAFIDGVVEAHRREHDIPGVAVSVVKDGRIVLAKGYGYADMDAGVFASGDETLFRIGSVSKTFIWTAVMMLAERGQIDLDADVNDYLKGVIIPEKFGAPVTMNHLMAHRAGFEDTFGVFMVEREGNVSLTDLLNKNMPARVFPPGARTSYSNWGSALAAKIVEDVTGESYSDFLFLEILKPLGMSSTSLSDPAAMAEELRARLSKGYKQENGAMVDAALMKIGPYAPVGAMSMSARDMGRWMQLHLAGGSVDGVRLMSPQTHEQMRERAFFDRPRGADAAHGFMSHTYRGHEAYGHGGATAVFFTYMDFYPELGLGVYVSQNATTNRTLVSNLSRLVVDHVIGASGPAADRQDEAAIARSVARANDAAGSYLGNRRSFTQFEKIMALTDVTTVAATDSGAIIVSRNGQTTQYVPVTDALDVYENSKGERLSFGRDENRRITHYTGALGVHSYDRVSGLSHPAAFNIALVAAVFFSITTWLGAWRRQGRASASSQVGFFLGAYSLAAAGLILALVGSLVAFIASVSSFSVADLANYPFPAITLFRLIATAAVITTGVSLLSLYLAWRTTGWSIWRKAHYTVFVFAAGGLTLLLIQWKVVFSATA